MDDLLDTFTASEGFDTNFRLECNRCGFAVCDIEPGDTLGVLARTARSHREEACA